jgi:hypothetical protein
MKLESGVEERDNQTPLLELVSDLDNTVPLIGAEYWRLG